MDQVAQTLAQLPQVTRAPTSSHSWDPLQFRDQPTSAKPTLAPHLFSARRRPAPRTRTRSVGRSASELVSSCRPRLPRLFVQAGDLRKQPISTRTNPVGLNRDIPATLLFIWAARASDSSVDAVLDLDAAFPAGNSYNGRYERLIVAFFLPQTLFGESLFYLLSSRLASPTRRPTGSYFLTTPKQKRAA
jgi:hypothetical protein